MAQPSGSQPPGGPAGAAGAPAGSQGEQIQQIEALVFSYWKKKGYSQEKFAQIREDRVISKEQYVATLQLMQDLNVPQYISFYNNNEQYPKAYLDSYAELRKWVDNSLDMYKAELMAAMYPVFVHCYLELIEKKHTQAAGIFMERNKDEFLLEHSDEIYRLQSVATPDLLKENETARQWRRNKYILRMCSYSFELLLTYLHDQNFMTLLSLINQHIHISVFTGQPQQSVEHRPVSSESPNEVYVTNRKGIMWGLLPEQRALYDRSALPPDVIPPVGSLKDMVADAMDVEDDDLGGRASRKRERKEKEPKPKKKGKGKDDEEEDAPVVAVPAVEPPKLVPLPKLKEEQEIAAINNLRLRAHLGADTLPSISFFTMFNTHNSLNTAGISTDCSLVAGGFSDSTIKLWDLNKARAATYKHYQENDGRAAKYKPAKDKESDFFELVGHSQPVYGLSFSPDNKFLLSSSADGTARLWSMDTKQNLVVYKGHSFPVWAVTFSPMGYYFATASHDRTARLWTTSVHYPHRIFAGHLADVNTVQFHPNCNYIITGSSDKCLRFWEVNTGSCVRIFTGHIAPVHTTTISPLGRFAASAGEDKDIVLWDLASSKKVAQCKGHTGTVWSLAVSGESTIMASGSADNTVRLWDMRMLGSSELSSSDADKSLLATYPTKYTPVFNLTFSNRNLLLATGPFKPPAVTTTDEGATR